MDQLDQLFTQGLTQTAVWHKQRDSGILDTVHKNKRSDIRFGLIEENLECGFVKQQLNFVLVTCSLTFLFIW